MKIKPQILIASGNMEESEFLERTLFVAGGYDILVSCNAQEALKKIYGRNIDLLIIDSSLSGQDAFEFVKGIKQEEDTRFTPVLLIVDENDDYSRGKGIASGCDDIISRPLDKEDIDTRVYTLIQISFVRPLLNEKEKFEYVLNNIGDGIIVFDSKLRAVHINSKAADLLEIDKKNMPNDILGHIKSRFKINYDGDPSHDITRNDVFFDIERAETDRTKALIIEARSKRVKNPLGELSCIIVTLANVTGKRREETLKQDFLSLISHKLRTPLTVIDGNISLFKEGILGELNEKQKNAIASMSKKTADLEKLLNKLIGFTKTLRDGINRNTEVIDLKAHIPSLLNPVINAQSGKKINLNIETSGNGLLVRSNKLYFDAVMENLAENAIKFNDKDEVDIDIGIKKDKNTVEITVADNGKGIPPEEKEKVFEKFYQVEKFFTGNVEGAGLGLAIVKDIIESMGGRVSLKSDLGRGSTFIFNIPA